MLVYANWQLITDLAINNVEDIISKLALTTMRAREFVNFYSASA